MKSKAQNNDKILGVDIFESLPAEEDEGAQPPPPQPMIDWVTQMEEDDLHKTDQNLEATYIDRPPVHNNRINVEKNLLGELLSKKREYTDWKDPDNGWKPSCLIPLDAYPIPPYPDWLCKCVSKSMVQHNGNTYALDILTEKVQFASHHFLLTCVMIKYIWDETYKLEDRDNLSFKYKELIDKINDKQEDDDGTELIKACCDGYNGTAPRLVLPISPTELWVDEQFQKKTGRQS
jgi:hypothetical protein